MFNSKQKEINGLIDKLEMTTKALTDKINDDQAEIANWKKKYYELLDKYNSLKENNFQMLSVINSKVPNSLKEIKIAYFASNDYRKGREIKLSELDELTLACQQFIIKHPEKDEPGKRLASVALLNFRAKDLFPTYHGYLTRIVINTTQNKEVDLIVPIKINFVSKWIEHNKTASILAEADRNSIGSAYKVENIPVIKLAQIVPVTGKLNSPDRYAATIKSGRDFMESLATTIDYRKESVIVDMKEEGNIQQAYTIWSPAIATNYVQKDLLRIINKDEA